MGKETIKGFTSLVIKQHNFLTEARYDMSALQKNILYLLLAKLKKYEPPSSPSNGVYDYEPEYRRCKYSVSMNEINGNRGVRVRRDELLKAARGLMKSIITLNVVDDESKGFMTSTLLSSVDFGEGKESKNLLMTIDPRMYPFLYDVNNRFTAYSLFFAQGLRSKYSKRIYEMLCQFKDTGISMLSVEELKKRLGLIDLNTGKEDYVNFADFDKNVLKVALKEINEQTDINFNYITKKKGKRVTNLTFFISHDPAKGRCNLEVPSVKSRKAGLKRKADDVKTIINRTDLTATERDKNIDPNFTSCLSMLRDFNVEYPHLQLINVRIPFIELRKCLEKVSDELREMDVPNKFDYVMKRLKEEHNFCQPNKEKIDKFSISTQVKRIFSLNS